MPDCTISDQQQNCLNNLQIDDIDAIILACNFEYGKGPVAFHLRNEGLLIQGTHISVLNGDVPIVQRPPFVVYSNNVVKITKDEEEISFKPTSNVKPTFFKYRLLSFSY